MCVCMRRNYWLLFNLTNYCAMRFLLLWCSHQFLRFGIYDGCFAIICCRRHLAIGRSRFSFKNEWPIEME